MSGFGLALAGVVVLAGVHGLSPVLERLPKRHQAKLASFSGGAGLAYVCLYLLFELVRDGAEKIHGLVRLSPDSLETLFVLLLTALTVTYVLQVHLEKTIDLRDDHRGYVSFFFAYNVLVGVGLVEEARWGALNLAFYVAALGLHLLFNDLFLKHHCARLHDWRWRSLLAAGPLVGSAVAAGLSVPAGVRYGMLALIAGGTIINVVRRELPDVHSLRPLLFVAGAVLYAGLIFATWRF